MGVVVVLMSCKTRQLIVRLLDKGRAVGRFFVRDLVADKDIDTDTDSDQKILSSLR